VGPFSRRKVKAEGPDRFVVRLDDVERRVLEDVCGQLVDALDQGAESAALRRLFPVAHAGDAELEAKYRDLVDDDLRAKRLADLRAVVEGVDARELDREGLERWMTAINSVRLVLGTVLDVGEEDPGPLDPEDPNTPTLVVYHFLGGLLDEIVRALSSTLS
jgi:hypothetical protein